MNAYARRVGGSDRIVVNLGMAVMFDQMVQAEIASWEITGSSVCFQQWLEAMLSGFAQNTERVGLGLRSRNAIPRIGDFGPSHRACRGVDPDSVRRVVVENGTTYAKSVEAGLAMVLLHELGHVVAGHTAREPSSLEESRRNETEADDFIAPTAARAGQGLTTSMQLLFLIFTQGASVDWERRSDHPLGARRALRLYQGFRREMATSEVLRRRLAPELRQDQIRSLDGTIARLRACVTRIDRGSNCVNGMTR